MEFPYAKLFNIEISAQPEGEFPLGQYISFAIRRIPETSAPAWNASFVPRRSKPAKVQYCPLEQAPKPLQTRIPLWSPVGVPIVTAAGVEPPALPQVLLLAWGQAIKPTGLATVPVTPMDSVSFTPPPPGAKLTPSST